MQRKRLLIAGLIAAMVLTPATAFAKTDLNSFIRSNVSSSLAKTSTARTPAGNNTSANTNNQAAQNTTTGETPQTSMAATIDTSAVSKGYVSVAYYNTSAKLKAYTELNGKSQSFSMKNDGNWTNVPLILGAGDYRISIMRNTSGDRYAFVTTVNVSYTDTGSMDKYLKSVPTMEYNSSMAPIQKAAALAAGKNDEGKVRAIYEYVVLNTSYDNEKVKKGLPAGYEPNIVDTFSTRKGICYDYAALFGAMCRSQGIPAKMIKGYVTNVNGYHAWNQVYVGGQWRVIDTTSDAVYRANGYSVDMFKAKSYEISITQEY